MLIRLFVTVGQGPTTARLILHKTLRDVVNAIPYTKFSNRDVSICDKREFILCEFTF